MPPRRNRTARPASGRRPSGTAGAVAAPPRWLDALNVGIMLCRADGTIFWRNLAARCGARLRAVGAVAGRALEWPGQHSCGGGHGWNPLVALPGAVQERSGRLGSLVPAGTAARGDRDAHSPRTRRYAPRRGGLSREGNGGEGRHCRWPDPDVCENARGPLAEHLSLLPSSPVRRTRPEARRGSRRLEPEATTVDLRG